MDPIRSATDTGSRATRGRAVALIASASLLVLLAGAGTVSGGASDHRNAENTFTKWIADFGTLTMAGFVGGDVGHGTYAGQIIDLDVTDTGLVIDATYEFSGVMHAFSARVHVVQTGFENGATAVITGRVTDGWLRGNEVAGAYTQIACEEAGTCFQGKLAVLRGSKD